MLQGRTFPFTNCFDCKLLYRFFKIFSISETAFLMASVVDTKGIFFDYGKVRQRLLIDLPSSLVCKPFM